MTWAVGRIFGLLDCLPDGGVIQAGLVPLSGESPSNDLGVRVDDSPDLKYVKRETTFLGESGAAFGQVSTVTFRRESWLAAECAPENGGNYVHAQVLIAAAYRSNCVLDPKPHVLVRLGSAHASSTVRGRIAMPLAGIAMPLAGIAATQAALVRLAFPAPAAQAYLSGQVRYVSWAILHE